MIGFSALSQGPVLRYNWYWGKLDTIVSFVSPLIFFLLWYSPFTYVNSYDSLGLDRVTSVYIGLFYGLVEILFHLIKLLKLEHFDKFTINFIAFH